MKFWRLCVYYYKPGKDWIRRMMRHFSSWSCLLLQSLCHSHHHSKIIIPNCVLFTSTWSSTTFFFSPLFATSKKSQMSWVQSFSLHISAKYACFLIIWRYQIKSLGFESTISLSRLTVIKQSHDKAPVLITAVSLCTVSPAGSDTVLYSEPSYRCCVYCQWRPSQMATAHIVQVMLQCDTVTQEIRTDLLVYIFILAAWQPVHITWCMPTWLKNSSDYSIRNGLYGTVSGERLCLQCYVFCILSTEQQLQAKIQDLTRKYPGSSWKHHTCSPRICSTLMRVQRVLSCRTCPSPLVPAGFAA